MSLEIILGPPGTGKTETLLRIMEDHLAKGVEPERMGFLAFTRKAATEARGRAMEKFEFVADDLPYFRTIHSLAFRQLSLSKSQVLQREHYIEFGDAMGIEVQGSVNMEEGAIYGMLPGDRLIFVDGLARNRMVKLEDQYNSMVGEDLEWLELERVSRALRTFKDARALIDYTDMLELYGRHGVVPDLDVLFIDEAQDLSKLQWSAVGNIIRNSQQVYIAGDDDQSIFRWAGADTDKFISMEGNVRTLGQSWRVPVSVQRVANNLISQINNRRPKEWESRKELGNVYWHADLDTIDMGQDTGTWLLLARNGYMLKRFTDHCMLNGYPFTGVKGLGPLDSPAFAAIKSWERLRRGETVHPDSVKRILRYMSRDSKGTLKNYPNSHVDLHTLRSAGLATEAIWHEALDRISAVEREYFIAARRAGETFLGEPRIKISTIHGVKGAEADNVVVLTDLAPRTFYEAQNNLDDELRVFYVAVTRAKLNLHLVQPFTQYGFLL
jgi:superfamily I DNA/RNA helicase